MLDKSDQIASLKEQIARLDSRLVSTQENLRLPEEELGSESSLCEVAHVNRRFAQVMMACESLYRRCCDSSTVQLKRVADPTDKAHLAAVTIEKLLCTQDHLLDFAHITKDVRVQRGGSPAIHAT